MMLLSSLDMPPLFDTYATVPGRYSCNTNKETLLSFDRSQLRYTGHNNSHAMCTVCTHLGHDDVVQHATRVTDAHAPRLDSTHRGGADETNLVIRLNKEHEAEAGRGQGI